MSCEYFFPFCLRYFHSDIAFCQSFNYYQSDWQKSCLVGWFVLYFPQIEHIFIWYLLLLVLLTYVAWFSVLPSFDCLLLLFKSLANKHLSKIFCSGLLLDVRAWKFQFEFFWYSGDFPRMWNCREGWPPTQLQVQGPPPSFLFCSLRWHTGCPYSGSHKHTPSVSLPLPSVNQGAQVPAEGAASEWECPCGPAGSLLHAPCPMQRSELNEGPRGLTINNFITKIAILKTNAISINF